MENYSKGKINKKLKKKRSVKRRTYTKEQLVEAVAGAQNGETAYKHGIAFGIIFKFGISASKKFLKKKFDFWSNFDSALPTLWPDLPNELSIFFINML
jgi:hypothetical protein